jgi:hypothetical protein
MAEKTSLRPDAVSDEEIAAAVGEELPDRKAMSTVTSGCGPEEFGVAMDSAPDTVIPPGDDPRPGPIEPAAPEEVL